MIVSFLTEQGGVGKTSLVFNLGWHLANCGKKVLLVDLDPQGGNLSRLLDVKDLDNKPGVADILRDPETYDFKNTAVNVKENLDIIPANEEAMEIPEIYKELGKDAECLKRSLDKVKRKYDFIFIDTSPSPSYTHVLTLVAADKMVIPLRPDDKSIDATQNVIDSYFSIKENLNPKLSIMGLVYNEYEQRSILSRVIKETLTAIYRKTDIRFTEAKIPHNIAISDAWAVKVGVTESSPRSKGAKAYRELAKELFGIEE